MSTKTEVKPEAAIEVETGADAEAKAVLEDTTIVSDKTFVRLMGSVDTHQKQVGGKWAALIEHCKQSLLAHVAGEKEFTELTKEEKEDLKKGKAVILKSLLEMGKTPSSAQSIRSYIIKMSKAKNAEVLEKLKAGDITVRASREAGRKAQAAPSLSNEERYRRALNDAARFGDLLGYSGDKIGDDAQTAFNEYRAKQNPEEVKAVQDKREMQKAIEETKKQIASEQ